MVAVVIDLATRRAGWRPEPDLRWASAVEQRVLAAGFRSVEAIDAFCADPDNIGAFQALEAVDLERARRLNAAVRRLRRELLDRAEGA